MGRAAINGIRICSSGGASKAHLGLTAAIAEAYTAIKNADLGLQVKQPASRREMEEELEAWRSKFPNFEFDGLQLCEK